MLFHPDGCTVCHSAWLVLSVCYGAQSIQKMKSEGRKSQKVGDNFAHLDRDSGILPGTSCPLWQCCCICWMLCDKVVLWEQQNDMHALSSLHSAVCGWLVLLLLCGSDQLRL